MELIFTQKVFYTENIGQNFVTESKANPGSEKMINDE
jgi:hypothetical protein